MELPNLQKAEGIAQEGRSAIDAIFDKRARWITVLVLMGIAFVAGAVAL